VEMRKKIEEQKRQAAKKETIAWDGIYYSNIQANTLFCSAAFAVSHKS
jgi:hypothetical protein